MIELSHINKTFRVARRNAGLSAAFRALLHKADSCALLALIQLLQRPSLKADVTHPAAMGGQYGLELTQQRGFPQPDGPHNTRNSPRSTVSVKSSSVFSACSG